MNGIVSPLPSKPNAFQQAINNAVNFIQKRRLISPVPDEVRNSHRVIFKPRPSASEMRITLGTPSPTVSPTMAPLVTPTPTRVPNQALAGLPITPDESYRGRTYDFQPDLYTAINQLPTSDYNKKLIFSLAAQESSGGRKLYGDYDNQGNPRSFGPFHIQRASVPMETRMDPYQAAKYAYGELQKYIDKGYSPEMALRMWNYNSGYVGSTWPRYDVELPYMATTSAFLKGNQ